MMKLFADITPSANSTWLVLVALSGIAGNIAQVLIARFTARRQTNEIYPQPLQVEMARKFADKHEFDQHVLKDEQEHLRFTDHFRKIEADGIRSMEKMSSTWRDWAEQKFDDLIKSNDRGRGELHDKINGAREELSALDATTAIQNQQLAAIQADIKRILERRT